jgi:hypothetical protein
VVVRGTRAVVSSQAGIGSRGRKSGVGDFRCWELVCAYRCGKQGQFFFSRDKANSLSDLHNALKSNHEFLFAPKNGIDILQASV